LSFLLDKTEPAGRKRKHKSYDKKSRASFKRKLLKQLDNGLKNQKFSKTLND